MLDALGYDRSTCSGSRSAGWSPSNSPTRHPTRVRRLVLAATGPGLGGVPGSPRVLLALATPRRYYQPDYYRRDRRADLRRPPAPIRTRCCAARSPASSSRPTVRGYLGQLYAITGWTSLPWLHRLPQPTLVLAGDDDPIVPLDQRTDPGPAHPRRPAARRPRRRAPVPPREPRCHGPRRRGLPGRRPRRADDDVIACARSVRPASWVQRRRVTCTDGCLRHRRNRHHRCGTVRAVQDGVTSRHSGRWRPLPGSGRRAGRPRRRLATVPPRRAGVRGSRSRPPVVPVGSTSRPRSSATARPGCGS